MQRLYAVSAAWADRLWAVGEKLALLAIPAVGGAVVAAWRARVRKRRAEADRQAHDREVLYAVAAVCQVLLERQLWSDWLTSTNRINPLPDGDVAEQRGAYRQREREAADRLRELLGNDRRGAARTTRAVDQPQDMFAAGDLEAGER